MVIFACAASAGAHAGLVPEHLHEAPALGVAFIASAVLLLVAGVTAAVRPSSSPAARAAALVLAGLIAAYAVSRTTGIPLVQPEPEPLDAVGVATKLIEALGLGFAVSLSQQAGGGRLPTPQEVSP